MTDQFYEAIRDVLSHLYDYAYLQEHPLALALDPEGRMQARERMRLLRSIVLEGIDQLAPEADLPESSPRPRCHRVLVLHYVDRLTIPQVSYELAVSERQVYRDLRQAESDLANLLWPRFHDDRAGCHAVLPGSPRGEIAAAEASRLPREITVVSISDLVRDVVAVLAQLAQQRQVRLVLSGLDEAGSLRTERQIIYQMMLCVVSQAIQRAQPGTSVEVTADRGADGMTLVTRYMPAGDAGQFPEVAEEFVDRLGGDCSLETMIDGTVALRTWLPDQQARVVLVIDDNEGVVELFRRYLEGEGFRVVGARTGRQGLLLAESIQPSVIVLDVLMPEEDGWAVLRQLVAEDSCRQTPVVICSVIDDRELALSLGATAFLAKPVSRLQLLEKVIQCQEMCPPR